MEEPKKYTLEELEKKLTEKERKFCHIYIVDWNGARAAREAGYSEKSCYDIGKENPRKPHIQQYIDFIKNDYEKEANISKLLQIKLLKSIIADKDANFRDKISATQELNKMLGYNEAEKHDHRINTNIINLGDGEKPKE